MRRDERGIALIIVLFATLLMTVIGLGMMYSTNMETAINHNYRDSQVALYAALAGLQEARDRIKYPYSITPPQQLPSTTAANIIYIVSDSSTVQPWDTTNAYFDTELCQENVLGLTGTPGVPCTTTATGTAWFSSVDNSSSSNAPWNLT
jgi:Tfp pilus assembly protein PilX